MVSTILIQTPRYSLGQHYFHLDFLGNYSTVPLHVQYIIVQNITTPHVSLDPFPSNLYLTAASTHRGAIIWGATATVAALTLISLSLLAFFISRRRRRRLSIDTKVEPFHQRHSTWQSRFRKNLIYQRLSDSSVNELGRMGLGPVVINNQLPLRYRVHQDSNEPIAQPGGGTIIVDLPPIYSTIRSTTQLATIPANHQPIVRDEGEESGV